MNAELRRIHRQLEAIEAVVVAIAIHLLRDVDNGKQLQVLQDTLAQGRAPLAQAIDAVPPPVV